MPLATVTVGTILTLLLESTEIRRVMNYAFISGIPTAGKSYLGKKLAEEMGIVWIALDDFREEMKKDPVTEYWVNFYWNQDPATYFATTSYEQQWEDHVKQSEAFWAPTKAYMESVMADHDAVVFEGVNLLPHLVRELPFKGVYLLGRSLEETIERNRREPRWSKDAEIQKIEAEHFYGCQGPHFRSEAEKYGYKSYTDTAEAEKELRKLLGAQ